MTTYSRTDSGDETILRIEGTLDAARQPHAAPRQGGAALRQKNAALRHEAARTRRARLAEADRRFGRLLDALAKSGRDDEAIVVVLADHGDAMDGGQPVSPGRA